MASTLTGSGELTYVSFPIDKMETDADGHVIVYGKASDGSVDSDEQIVDPKFAGKAIQEWLESGANIRVQHNPQLYPAGVGVDVEAKNDGSTWVRAKIVESNAKNLVKAGALRAYSVGIARPTIVRDNIARGGRITDGQIVEISLVDRPANKNCGIQLVKSASDGTSEFVEKVFGSSDILTKARANDSGDHGPDDMTTPSTETDPSDFTFTPTPLGVSTPPTTTQGLGGSKAEGGTFGGGDVLLTLKEDDTIAVTPNDLARLVARKSAARVTDEVLQGAAEGEYEVLAKSYDAETLIKDHRNFSTDRRRSLAQAGNALPDGSYPIPDADALGRAAILARSGHGNAAAARRLIARRAEELKVPNPLTEHEATKSVDNVAEPEIEKESTDGIQRSGSDHADDAGDSEADDMKSAAVPEVPKAKKPKPAKGKKAKGGKNMPPWLKDKEPDAGDGDADGDGDDGAGDGTKSEAEPEAVKTVEEPEAEKSDATPGSASGAKGEDDETPAPTGELKEREAPKSEDNEEAAASMRFKSLNVPYELGQLHDMYCPAYSSDALKSAYPNARLNGVNDLYWQEKAYDAASSQPLDVAKELTTIWQHAMTLKMTDEDILKAVREELHKSFQDANPGPGSSPTPGSIVATRFNRGVITAGHAANSPQYGGPNSHSVPSGQISAQSYRRGDLSAGHAADSPGNKSMSPQLVAVPKLNGALERTDFVAADANRIRSAMGAMHDHITQTFPDICCLAPEHVHGSAGNAIPTSHGTPSVSAVKSRTGKEVIPEAVLMKGAAKKMKKKLGKKVLAGKITVDEARAKMGRMQAQKVASKSVDELVDAVNKGLMTINEARVEYGLSPYPEPEVAKAAHPDPLVKAFDDKIGPDTSTQIASLVKRFEAQEVLIQEQAKLLAAMASEPDPASAAFKGLATNPNKTSQSPGGAVTVAKSAEAAQAMILRELEGQARNSYDSAQREAAWASIRKMKGLD